MRETLDWEKEGSSVWKIYRNRSLGAEEDCTPHQLAQGLSLSPAPSQGLLLPSPACSVPVQPGKEFVFLLSLVLPWCPSGPILLSPMPSCGV